MTMRLLPGLMVALLLAAGGCVSGDRTADDRDVERRTGQHNFTYDKFGFQVDSTTGEPIDSAYNRQLEKLIGR